MVNKRLLALARRYSNPLIITITTGFLSGILIVGQAWTLSQSVDAVFIGGLKLSQISGTLQTLLFFIFGRAVMIWLGKISAGYLARGIKNDLRERLYRHLIRLGPTYVRGERTGELINTVVDGIEALDAWFSEYLPQLVLAALVPVTFLVFIFPRDLLTGFVLLLTAPLIPIFMYLIGSLADALTKKQWKSLSRMSAHFLDVLQGLTTLKILGRSREQIDWITKVSTDFRKTTLGVLRVAFLSALVLEITATLSTAVVAVEIGLRLLYGRMIFSDAFFVLLLAPEFYLPLRMLGTRFHAGASGVAAAQRIFEVLEREPKTHARELTSSISDPSNSVSFKNVSYTYPDDRTALRNISFDIEPGQKIALVGPSGAGKSTITHLILGFMQPTEGSISTVLLTGTDTAWLPQHPYLFNDSIAANIRLARPDASMGEVIAAAKAAHAHEFIIKMENGSVKTSTDDDEIIQIHRNPFQQGGAAQSAKSQHTYRGYETYIGERGARLSGGEAQRIALARAFLMDASFIILDEPTAHLDPELESQIQESTDRLLKSRTALTIAHRLDTIIKADKIIVLDQGRIVEIGRHDELLENCDFYAQMVREMDTGNARLKAVLH
ncbi:MAG: thiol reductant ABC exporter subunit CydD, partial [Chloroflexi bacterium]|nr:thiol reductant ABC exporter subunit CydD [Chloroflexota bacterium]